MGAFFFGTLWLTVRRLPDSRHPALTALGGYVLRMAVVLSAFYVLAHRGWEGPVAGLVGFLVARRAIVRLVQPTPLMQCAPSARSGVR